MSEEIKAIVIDNGSGTIKAGLSGEKKPRKIFPSIVGRPKKNTYIGEEVFEKEISLDLEHPIQHGIVTNWDDMEIIYNYTFYNILRSDPSEHPILVTEASNNSRESREKLVQLMFEKFNVPSFYTCNQGVLSIYSSNKTTGVVVDIGYGICQIIPIFEGKTISKGILSHNIAGYDLTDRLRQLFNKRNVDINDSSENQIFNDIKEKHCYVALDYESELQKAKSSTDLTENYKLSENKIISINEERFSCPELLFKPYFNGFEFAGIDKSLFIAINNSDTDVIKNLYENIVLTGGTSLLKGIQERIEKEIKKLAQPTMKINVVAPTERNFAAWIGGSILASLPQFSQLAISSSEYKESGSSIIHEKCI